MKLEVVLVPVSDVDRAKSFYQQLGWRLDADFVTGEDFRVVQMTAHRLGVLDHLRHRAHLRRARLPRGSAAHRVRHPTRRGADLDGPRRRRRRDLPRRGRRLPSRRDRGQGARPRPRARRLRLVRSRSATPTATAGAPGNQDLDCPDVDRTTPDEETQPMDVETLTELLQEAEEHHGAYEATAPPHHWSQVVRRLHRRARPGDQRGGGLRARRARTRLASGQERLTRGRGWQRSQT